MNTILAKAVAFGEALKPEFKTYARQVVDNAKALADGLKKHDFRLITGGTENHLILIDVDASRGLDGRQAEARLEDIGLTCNKNVIPGDKRPAYAPSGLRIGTPGLTTRGLQPEDMEQIAGWFNSGLEGELGLARKQELREQVRSLARRFPPPSN